MDKIIKNVLQKITDANYEAYVVGGFVRDYLLGIKSTDVDICTNALPKDLHKLFPLNNNSNDYGGFNLKVKNYNIDITTYRKEITYEGRKPTEIVYLNDLKEDLLRRDFTINAVCMDLNEKIIDHLNGVDDINQHIIKIIGDPLVKIKEDPLRILRAIRFASVLNFDLDTELYTTIKENYELVNNLSKQRIKEEITKILLHKNFKKGLNLLNDLGILKLLNISYQEINFVNDICGMWAQLEYPSNFPFTKQEIRNIINIRQIMEDGKVDNHTLYTYGLYNSLVASDILNINKDNINKMYQKLEIKNEKDLDISSEEIMEICQIGPSKEIKEIKNSIINLILEDKLKNNKNDIKEYLKRKEM